MEKFHRFSQGVEHLDQIYDAQGATVAPWLSQCLGTSGLLADTGPIVGPASFDKLLPKGIVVQL